MLAAVENGDAKELAELMRQDPGFNVNMDQDGDGWPLLHYACLEDHRSAVIPLLLAHPVVDVNAKTRYGETPFFLACLHGSPSCAREMLKDPRVKVNEPNNYGRTPFSVACSNGSISCVREMLKDFRVKMNVPSNGGYTPLLHIASSGCIDSIKVWIASGREMDFGTPGDEKTDAIGVARRMMRAQRRPNREVAVLLERFRENPVETRHAVRVELHWYNEAAAEMFAMVVFVSDGLLQIKDIASPTARFFSVAVQLPLELQMTLCCRAVGSAKEIIPGRGSESAFKDLAKKLL